MMKDDNKIFELLLEEIEKSIKNDLFFSALALALTIPDICGKAEYPFSKSNKFRYVAWYDAYLGVYDIVPWDKCGNCEKINTYIDKLRYIYENEIKNNSKGTPKSNYDFPCSGCDDNSLSVLHGKIVYDLRCAFLHSGSPGLEKENNREEIPRFTLTLGKTLFGSFSGHGTYEISVSSLCERLLIGGKNYYLKYKEKFDFFDYNIQECNNTYSIPHKLEVPNK